MAITFNTNSPVLGIRVVCVDGELRDDRIWNTNATLTRIDREHAAVCPSEDCVDGGLVEPVRAVAIDPVEVGRGHMRVVMDALGLIDEDNREDPYGELPADDFAGRVLMALALTPTDEGVPAYGDGRWMECGRRPGYLQDVLGRLHALAEAAGAHDLTICWA